MQTKTFLAALLAAFPAARAFKFTGPNPSEPIDISKEVTITWEGDIPDNLLRNSTSLAKKVFSFQALFMDEKQECLGLQY
ncbi:hypothetical protein FNAPI_2027 [Fusarium napiforme]|uniref:Uncharacterized protein n=1 Tax=Fusarium napiforme TaxID=42672 RepID=A0A8H5K2B2_9HYPO|nr:hypothetical protein FNAPI_2027 [Fusarium napiforme]